jgi:Putative Flp pilus-assembly TadE/G-like
MRSGTRSRSWSRALRGQLGREDGQIIPLLIVIMVSVIALGIALFQVGRAADLKAQGQTAADAAALGAEHEIKDEMIAAMLVSGEGFTPLEVNDALVQARAEEWAQRNGAHVISYQRLPTSFDVSVIVETNKELNDKDADRVGANGFRGQAKASATIDAAFNFGGGFGIPSFGGGGGGPGGGGNLLSDADIKKIEDAAGVQVAPWSALRFYGGCGCTSGSVDVADLQFPMQVAIAKAEALLHHRLPIISAFRTVQYQASLCATQGGQGGRCAPAGSSMHNAGLAMDVSPHGDLAAIASKVGLCEPFPGANDDNNHFSWAGDRECGGQAGVLGGAGSGGVAFGGNISSFVNFDIHLIPWKGIAP